MADHRRRYRALANITVSVLMLLGWSQIASALAQNATTKGATKSTKEPEKKVEASPDAPIAEPKEAGQPETTKKPETEPAKTEQSAEAPLPTKTEMLRNLPSKADLLTKPPFDWVILKKDETVLTVKPVQPRPKTLEQMAEKRKQYLQPPKLTQMTGETKDAFADRLRTAGLETEKMRKKMESIEIELPDTTKVSEDQDDSAYLLN